MAGDFPLGLYDEQGKIRWLNDGERALLRFHRALPPDLQAEFVKVLGAGGKGNDAAFVQALASFESKLGPRRSELVGWES